MVEVEIAIGDSRPRGVALLRGLEASAEAFGVKVHLTDRYSASAPVLMLWGAGDPIRNKWFKQHIAKGGTAVCWDMGYWDAGRGVETLGMNRLSVNSLHPQSLMFSEWDSARFDAKPVKFEDKWNPKGHIVLVGLGPKTVDQYAFRQGEWERKKLEAIKAAFPKRRIVYRPKPNRPYDNLNIETQDGGRIEDVLNGASLVVCRHSNVAIDAMRMGIPASVEDGAAAAVYGPELLNREPVSPEVRAQFFHNLAWLQWSIQEAWKGDCWPFLKSLIGKRGRSRTSSQTAS